MDQKPSICRMVVYVDHDGAKSPAVVVVAEPPEAWPPGEQHCVTLTAFGDFRAEDNLGGELGIVSAMTVHGVPYDAAGARGITWHWPPRA